MADADLIVQVGMRSTGQVAAFDKEWVFPKKEAGVKFLLKDNYSVQTCYLFNSAKMETKYMVGLFGNM
eukprot:6265096-Lingulodinium_polyedra.AAC.1